MNVYSASTVGATAPIDNLGLIDLEAVIFLNVETWGRSDGAVDIEDQAAASAHQMMVVVANAVFVSSRRAGGLNPTDQTLVGEDGDRVVDRLPGDRADLVSHDLGQLLGGGMGASGDGLHDRKTLCRDLKPATSELLLEASFLDQTTSEWLLLRYIGHGEDSSRSSGLSQESDFVG